MNRVFGPGPSRAGCGGLSSVNSIVQGVDNDDQNVVFVVNDVGENVGVVTVAAVAAEEGGKSKKDR